MLAFMAGPSDSSCSPTAFLRLTYVRFFSVRFFIFGREKIYQHFSTFLSSSTTWERALIESRLRRELHSPPGFSPPPVHPCSPSSSSSSSSSWQWSPCPFFHPKNTLLPPAELLSCAQHTAQMLSSPFSHRVCMSDRLGFFF